MADNIDVTPGSGKTIAADDIGGVLHQRVKLAIGDDGSNDGDVSAANPMPVDGSGVTQPVSGTITANAGTNLNTSALALETGGNLAGATTSLAVIDDWDESDRAKVNPIAGQAGVQGGSGTVSATTQRVVLATDVALPAGTNAIGKLSANSGVDIGDVDVTSSALPTGASTSAKQDTIIGHVDGIETLLGTIDADTSALAATDFATEAKQDDIITAIGSIPGGGVQYTEGDTDASITGTAILWEDGSNTLKTVNATDRLPVDIGSATVTVDASDIQIGAVEIKNSSDDTRATVGASGLYVDVQGAGLTALQLIDDAVYVDDADWTDNTSKHLLVGGVYQSTPHTVTDGDVTPFLTDENGRLETTASIDTTGLATSAKQDTIIGHVDGIETLIGTTNTTLTTIDGRVDGIEGLLGTTNTNTGASTTALQIIDDWDESDRAKVNLIAGQAGVQGGAGAVSATTQRIAIATDANSVSVGNALGSEAYTRGGFTELSGLSSASNGSSLMPATDVSAYKWVSVHITSISATALFEGSNDNFASSIIPVTLNRISQTLATPATDTTAADIYAGPVQFRYMRIRQSGAGAIAAVVELYTSPTAPLTISGQVAINGTQASNVAQIAGTTTAVNTGTANNGTLRVTLATDIALPAPGVAATSLGKSEDAAAASGDTGIAVFGVRNDALTAAQTNATGDYGSPSIDTSGILITAGAPRALKGRQVTTITSSTSETTIVTAVASTFLDMYGLILTNTSATVTKVSIRDATAGGTISVFEVPATETRGFMLPLDSAVPQAAVNNNWTAQCGTSVAALEVTVLYVKRV